MVNLEQKGSKNKKFPEMTPLFDQLGHLEKPLQAKFDRFWLLRSIFKKTRKSKIGLFRFRRFLDFLRIPKSENRSNFALRGFSRPSFI